jgi:hypothetical protein
MDITNNKLVFKEGFSVPDSKPILLGPNMRIDGIGGHIRMGGSGGCNSLLVVNDGKVYTGSGTVTAVPNDDQWKSCWGNWPE